MGSLRRSGRTIMVEGHPKTIVYSGSCRRQAGLGRQVPPAPGRLRGGRCIHAGKVPGQDARRAMDALVEACQHDTLYMHAVRNLVDFYGNLRVCLGYRRVNSRRPSGEVRVCSGRDGGQTSSRCAVHPSGSCGRTNRRGCLPPSPLHLTGRSSSPTEQNRQPYNIT